MTTESRLATAGFKHPSTTVSRRLIALVQGFDKSGKTEYAIQSPEPVMVISNDRGTEGIVERQRAGGLDIYIYDLRERPILPASATAQTISTEWTGVWKRLIQAMKDVYAVGEGTLVWDTETALWETKRLMSFGRQSNVQHLFTEVNAAYREEVIAPAFAATNMSTIFLERFKAKYVNDKWDGQAYERSGFREMPYEVQVNVEVRRQDENGRGELLSPPVFSSVILNSRINGRMGGSVVPGGMSSFNSLLGMLHGVAG